MAAEEECRVMESKQRSRPSFRVLAVALGTLFLGIGIFELIQRPNEWLNLASSLVMILVGFHFMHAGFTDQWNLRGAVSRDNTETNRTLLMTVEPLPADARDETRDRGSRPAASVPNSSPNPYDPPRSLPADAEGGPSGVWLQDSPPELLAEQFLAGQPFIHYGIVFFLERDNETAIHAALPLSASSEALVARNVDEAMRVLPEFLSALPGIEPHVRGRSLIIRMIASYRDLNEEVCDRVIRELEA